MKFHILFFCNYLFIWKRQQLNIHIFRNFHTVSFFSSFPFYSTLHMYKKEAKRLSPPVLKLSPYKASSPSLP